MENSTSCIFLIHKRKIAKAIFSFISSLTCLLLFCAPGTSFAASVSHFSSPDPLVIIASDITPPDCKWTVSIVRNQHIVPNTAHTLPCIPGAIVTTKRVLLSQAKAMHEQYVVPPLGQPSPTTLAKYRNDINQLETAKRTSLRNAKKNLMSPASSCGETEEGGGATTVYYDRVYMDVRWTVSNDCSSVFIDYMELEGLNVVNNIWWFGAYYASSLGNTRCPPGFSVQNGGWYTWYFDNSDSSGYDAVWDIATVGNPCATTDFADTTIAYGPLT